MIRTSQPRHGQKIVEEGVPNRQFQQYIDDLSTIVLSLQTVNFTSAELLDIKNPVNTEFKYLFKFNTTLNRPYFPVDSSAGADWVDSDGLNPITPN